MPLRLDKCGSLGGDVEMIPIVRELALRHPDDEFILIGRNDGSIPERVGLPSNVTNPWTKWGPQLRKTRARLGLNKANLTIAEHFAIQDIFDELTLPTILGLDNIILWAGQHGTTNTPLPSIKDPNVLTKPYDWCAHYCSFLLRGVNLWRDVRPFVREEIWLNSDARNRLKMRDLKWPLRHPVLTQHAFDHPLKHERYDDNDNPHAVWGDTSWSWGCIANQVNNVWTSTVRNIYARLEINGLLPGTPFGNLISFDDNWENRQQFGLFINETRRYVREDISRVRVVQKWVLPLQPDWIHGTWSSESLKELNLDIKPALWDQYFPRLHSVRSTFTAPASGTGWATAKPWEAFAAGTVCFFHPGYDVQDNILADAPSELRNWLRVSTPKELYKRVTYLNTPNGRGDWEWLVRAQRAHFDTAVVEARPIKMIEQRLYEA
jgi:hypothetical protein